MSDITFMADKRLSAVLDRQQSKSSSKLGKADNNNNQKEITKVAKEMESLFAYQLLKIMRKTSEGMSSGDKDSGYDTYMSLFDMEVSKLLADRGLGLQDSIVEWINRIPVSNNKDDMR